MSRQQSITSSASFRRQFLRAERWRLGLLLACFAVTLAAVITRRSMDELVMEDDDVFVPSVLVLAAGIAMLSVAFIHATFLLARGKHMPRWSAPAGLAIDLGVPYALLSIMHVHSPRGEVAALSGPSLLIVPIVIMLSSLRLRPLFSFLTGLLAAGGHWALVYDTYADGEAAAAQLPLLASYGVLLLVTGCAAAMISLFVRRYIEGAAQEALEAERTARILDDMEHDLDIARVIQQGLLPAKSPHHPAFDIAAMARPAAKAGGDYYDWQPLPNGQLVVAVADVTGHGIGPALVMAVCRAYARATAPTSAGLSELLERLNTLIVDDVKGQRFVTMAVAMLDPDGGIDLLSAGHGPTFLYRAATGEVAVFGGDALPLGIIHDEVFGPINHLQLSKGDALVMLTDGFLERLNPEGAMFGLDRLTRLVARNAARPPVEIVQMIDDEVESFADGAVQNDDMTLVVIRRR